MKNPAKNLGKTPHFAILRRKNGIWCFETYIHGDENHDNLMKTTIIFSKNRINQGFLDFQI